MQGLNQALHTSGVPDGLAGSTDSAGEGGFAHNPTRPQLCEEFLFGDEAVAMLDEIGQQVEYLGFDFDRPTGAAQLIAL
jgi:hypothetical protein